jgi:hypothetical protein
MMYRQSRRYDVQRRVLPRVIRNRIFTLRVNPKEENTWDFPVKDRCNRIEPKLSMNMLAMLTLGLTFLAYFPYFEKIKVSL